ncbi:MAG: MarR family transcriptional regulator [Bacteroidales bacterium]|nr:MarR family transcriptional regulator [Clostridium sp.]MCM1204507.1 MarR family transcriptional regulator [Bacteroidales bacterium]
MNAGFSKELKRYNHLITEIDAVYHTISLKFGLSDSAMVILYTLCEAGGSCLLQDICRTSGMSKQTLNSALRKLESEDILYLEPAGAKNKKVCLTEKGKLLAEQTALKIITAENDIFLSWAQEDVEKYLELTERYLHTLQEKSREL